MTEPRSLQPYTRMLAMSGTIFVLCLVPAVVLDSAPWAIGAVVFGFVTFLLGIFWIPVEVGRRAFRAFSEHRAPRPLKPVVRIDRSGVPYACTRPALPFRAIALVAAIAIGVPSILNSGLAAAFGAVVLGAAARVTFFMDVRADASGVRVRQFLQTTSIPASDVISVRTNGQLAIFGPRYEPICLRLNEDQRFASAANELLKTEASDGDQSVFDLALGYDVERGLGSQEHLIALMYPVMMTFVAGVFVVSELFGFSAENPKPPWLLPVAAASLPLGLWWLSRQLRSYRAQRDWAPFAEKIESAAAEHSQSTGRTLRPWS